MPHYVGEIWPIALTGGGPPRRAPFFGCVLRAVEGRSKCAPRWAGRRRAPLGLASWIIAPWGRCDPARCPLWPAGAVPHSAWPPGLRRGAGTIRRAAPCGPAGAVPHSTWPPGSLRRGAGTIRRTAPYGPAGRRRAPRGHVPWIIAPWGRCDPALCPLWAGRRRAPRDHVPWIIAPWGRYDPARCPLWAGRRRAPRGHVPWIIAPWGRYNPARCPSWAGRRGAPLGQAPWIIAPWGRYDPARCPLWAGRRRAPLGLAPWIAPWGRYDPAQSWFPLKHLVLELLQPRIAKRCGIFFRRWWFGCGVE